MYKKLLFAITFILTVHFLECSAQKTLPYLKVASNKHFLVKDDGKNTPFFWMGDSGWMLLYQNKADIDLYLETRSKQNFNVIAMELIAESLQNAASETHEFQPDANGSLPFSNQADLMSFNEPFFANLDYVVNKAASLGLYLDIVPLWAQDMERYSDAQLNSFGKKLGKRYGSKTNVIWIAGGESAGEATPSKTNAMAAGLKEGGLGRQLVSVHPTGQSSSSSGKYWVDKERNGVYNFHNESWLDFNMIQSGHIRGYRNYLLVMKDYNLKPAKPTLESEYFYEDLLNWPDRNNPNAPRATAQESRIGGYWAVFSGSMGYTYGHHAVWSFYQKGAKSVFSDFSAPTIDWKTALYSPGAKITCLRNLMESRPYQETFPAQELLLNLPKDSLAVSTVRVLRNGEKGKNNAGFIMVYIPEGRSATINSSCITGENINTWLFNPVNGKCIPQLKKSKNPGKIEIKSAKDYQDRVLIIDDDSLGFKNPGNL